jgi:hypothetical protein
VLKIMRVQKQIRVPIKVLTNFFLWECKYRISVADLDPNPPDPHVLGLLDPDPDPLVRGIREYLREFSKKFEMVLMGYSGVQGKLI